MAICQNPECKTRVFNVAWNQEGFNGCDHYCSRGCCEDHYSMSGHMPPENMCPCY